jgi:hypothetical protein
MLAAQSLAEHECVLSADREYQAQADGEAGGENRW